MTNTENYRADRAVALLNKDPTTRYGIVVDDESGGDDVIVALAIRGVATCELLLPRDRYDSMAFLECVEMLG